MESVQESKGIVYLIDDSEMIRICVRQVISSHYDLEIKEFSTGEEMMNELTKEMPVLAIIDYILGEKNSGVMNGLDTLKILRKHFPKMKAILLTGVRDEDAMKRLKKEGFNKVIFKERESVFDILTDAINELLKQKQP